MAPWLDRLRERLDDIARSETPCIEGAIVTVTDMIEAVAQDPLAPEPVITHVHDGGLTTRWRHGPHRLEVFVRPEKSTISHYNVVTKERGGCRGVTAEKVVGIMRGMMTSPVGVGQGLQFNWSPLDRFG